MRIFLLYRYYRPRPGKSGDGGFHLPAKYSGKKSMVPGIDPGDDTFLSLDNLFQNQPYSLLEQLTTNDALSKLYINEGRDFMIGLDKYLQSLNLADNPDAAHQEIKEYYAAKEQEILSLSIPDYLKYIYGKTLNRDSSVVSAYLYQFGVSGLTFLDTQGRSSFLLFSPRKDMVIKEIRRQSPAYTLLAS
jgi:hypothetical protein